MVTHTQILTALQAIDARITTLETKVDSLTTFDDTEINQALEDLKAMLINTQLLAQIAADASA